MRKSFITHAAIMFSNGEVVEGTEYQAINNLARRIGFSGERIDGFVNSSGEFVLPQDAAEIALKSGQIKAPIKELVPDDLWPPLITD
jgi:hypothetical protein